MAGRKYFGTDGIRGLVGEGNITAEFVMKLGWAAGKVFAKQMEGDGKAKLLIGKDTRISGYMFESALEAGLSAAGADVRLLGPMPTPAIAYLTRAFRAQAGIVISASHNPYHDNGIKFFSTHGTKLPDELEIEIEKMLDEPMVTCPSFDLGKVRRINGARGRYIEFCKSTLPYEERNFSAFKVVVDCANGATYDIAPDALDELGLDVVRIGVSPDGFNINEDCGSTDPIKLQQAVIEHKADFGVAFDGDGDRLIFVDELGQLIDGDQILYILAKHKLAKNEEVEGVVGTKMSNLGLEVALKKLGIDFYRADVGDRYVIQALQERGWTLGGESSGHIVCLDKTTTGDGIISALQVMHALLCAGVPMSELSSGMKKFPQTMINVSLPEKTDPLGNQSVKNAVSQAEDKLGDRGRVLLRLSGTEPLVRVMVEGEEALLVSELAKTIAESVQSAIA